MSLQDKLQDLTCESLGLESVPFLTTPFIKHQAKSSHITLPNLNSFKFFMSSCLLTSPLCHGHVLSLKSLSTSDLSSNRRPSQSEVEQSAIISLSANVHPTRATFHDSNPITALCVLPSASSLLRGRRWHRLSGSPGSNASLGKAEAWVQRTHIMFGQARLSPDSPADCF